jgi:hypothetical protein
MPSEDVGSAYKPDGAIKESRGGINERMHVPAIISDNAAQPPRLRTRDATDGVSFSNKQSGTMTLHLNAGQCERMHSLPSATAVVRKVA